MGYWITLQDGTQGYCDGASRHHAMAKAAEVTGKTVIEAHTIPYPAEPTIFKDPQNDCPPFCTTPSQCAGRTSCPKPHACND